MKVLVMSTTIAKVFGELLFLYGLLGWVYGVLVQMFHPEWISLPLSHLATWIRVDTFSIMCFILSAVGFSIWQLTKELLSRSP
jgi:hypothetical protein